MSKLQNFSVSGKVVLKKAKEARLTKEKLPDKNKFFKYMTSNKKFLPELVKNIAYYQYLYDKTHNIKLDKDLNLTFTITNNISGKSLRGKNRIKEYNNIMTH